jgi:spore maturation protein CgeB
VCFIGHHEPERQELIEAILQRGIPVFVAGRGWRRWARKRAAGRNLHYGGAGIYGHAYVAKLSEYRFGLGLLSKWVPEIHTSRTFEIPACGAVLVTEPTVDTTKFFKQREALFFKDTQELLGSLEHFIARPEQAQEVAESGQRRVLEGAYDYDSIVGRVLTELNERSA